LHVFCSVYYIWLVVNAAVDCSNEKKNRFSDVFVLNAVVLYVLTTFSVHLVTEYPCRFLAVLLASVYQLFSFYLAHKWYGVVLSIYKLIGRSLTFDFSLNRMLKIFKKNLRGFPTSQLRLITLGEFSCLNYTLLPTTFSTSVKLFLESHLVLFSNFLLFHRSSQMFLFFRCRF